MPIVVSLVQITEDMLQFVNLPYAVALLQAFVQQWASDPGRYLFTLPIFERRPLEETVSRLRLSQVVGFSLYVWNAQYSLALAQELKRQRPETLIVVGGPHVPDDPESFLQSYPWIDLCVHGEGEETFLEILEQFPHPNWSGITGLSYRQGSRIFTRHRPRSRDLSRSVSPFLSGVLDPLLQQQPRRRWVSAWETNRGCPFSCSFCDWGSSTASKIQSIPMARLEAEMDWFVCHQIEVIFCCDANFGVFPRDLEIAQSMAQRRQRYGYPKLLYTQTAKNAPERVFQTQKTLFDAGLHTGTTLSMQSISEPVLRAIRRENISLQAYQQLQSRFRQAGIPTYTDVLVGLPGETLDSFRQGVGQMIAQGQHQEMRFYNVFILPNAELAQPAYRQRYQLKSVKIPYLTPQSPIQSPVSGIHEIQEMLISSHSFTPEDWLEMRIFAWMTQILYFSQALQIPMILLHQTGIADYTQMITRFCQLHSAQDFPFFSELNRFLRHKAQEILSGQHEFCAGQEPLSQRWTWMYPDYFVLAQLIFSEKLEQFFREGQAVLEHCHREAKAPLPLSALQEAARFSEALFRSKHPQQRYFRLYLNWNLWPYFQGVLRGLSPELENSPWFFEAQRDAKQKLHYHSVSLRAPHQLFESGKL